LHQALGLFRALGDRASEGIVLNNLGEVARSLGRLPEALGDHEEALGIFRQLGDRAAEGAVLRNLGEVAAGLDRLEDALRYLEGAAAIARELDDRAAEGAVLNDLGQVAMRMDQPDWARAYLELAIAIARDLGDRASEGIVLNNLGEVARSLDRLPEALGYHEEALGIFREVGDRAAEGVVLGNLGVVSSRVGRSQEALAYYEEAIGIEEDPRATIRGDDLRLTRAGDPYRAYASLLSEQGEGPRALQVAERAKARTFVELLEKMRAPGPTVPADVPEATTRTRRNGILAGADPELREGEQRLLGELGAVRRGLLAQHVRPATERSAAVVHELATREQEIQQAYQANQAEIRVRTPRYASLTQPETWDVSEVQNELLDEHTALLEYVLGDDRSLLFCALKDDFEVFSLPGREGIEQQVRELRVAVAHGLHAYPHGHELYTQLVEPTEELIDGKDLLICPDGALHYLPFSLLLTEPSGADAEADLDEVPAFDFPNLPYLVRSYATAYAPSVTVAGLLHRELNARERSYDGELAAFADPVGLGVVGGSGSGAAHATNPLKAALAPPWASLAPIPSTADEIWQVAGLVSAPAVRGARPERYDDARVSLRTAGEATKDEVAALTSGERRFRFLHIASHGVVDTDTPQFSSLVFSPGKGGDPFWQTFEIFNANVPSELVCLSACETGLGKIVSGEGIVGLTRAFLYAGAAAVCVSLWKVAEESSPRLMECFYGRLLAGEPTARSLQQAQLKLLDEGLYTHPYWWAPFVVVGE
jgi:CHAT domain-containing protein/tetratricopeptide (TPR) repeat protein